MLPAGTRLGPYEILSAVGAGGMGQVYSARDTRLDRSVAIKVLPPQLSSNSDFKLRFEREARVISALNHPHICTLHDVGETVIDRGDGNGAEDVAFLVMELCDGQSLAERLEKAPLPVDHVLRYAIQIAGALDRAHRSGITHRDLKPANIMLTRSGAKLLDFGLAKGGAVTSAEEAGAEDATRQKPLTEEGAIVGTFQYMAPEQVEGMPADPRSDIFAFGSILYEMLTGKRAFEGRTRASLIASILDRDPQPISTVQPLVPSALERVVRTCLAKDPDERWQSAHDLMRELEWIRDGISSPSTQAVPHARSARRWLPWAVAAVFAILALAAMWMLARAPGRVPQRLISAIAPPADAQFIVTGDAAGPVTLSPDGRWATYIAFSENATRLWLQSLESGEAAPLAGTEEAMFPFWSPDSRAIGFFAAGKLKTVELDGSSLRILADAPDARSGAWGPGGEIIYAPHTQSGIMRVQAGGGTPSAVTEVKVPFTTHRWPEFLPDGRSFVYLASSHGDPSGATTGIYLGSLEDGAPRKIVTAATHAVPYGDYLLYVQSSRLIAQRFRDGALAGEPVRIRDDVLTDPGTWRSIFSVSRTGLLAYHPGGATLGSRLVWMSREGKQLSETPPRPIGDIKISPDGQSVAFAIGDPKGTIFIHDISSGVETRLSFVEGSALAPVWSRDGRHVVFSALTSGVFQLLITSRRK